MFQLSYLDGFLIEFMSFFDKKNNKDLLSEGGDFFLTFLKQQIIKWHTLKINCDYREGDNEILRTK